MMMKHMTMKGALAGFAFLMAGLMPSIGSAFPLTAQLTGDPRVDNPDNLIIDVSITATDSDTVQFRVDINSPLHPDAKLDEFYFNVVTPAGGSFDFGIVAPAGWTITSPATPVGGGSIAFVFESNGPNPPNNVTNAIPLIFNMNLLGGGSFTDAMFLDAGTSCSSDTTLGCGQLGAHLQSLNASNGQSDSGFLLGYYGGDRPPTRIPEPGTMALLGAMILAMGLAGMRRRVQ